MKIVGLILIAVIAIIQYQIWLGESGAQEIEKLKNQILEQQNENEALRLQNQVLKDEIEALRHNPALLEELAREQLGLIKPSETFYRIIPKDKD